jgi:hypothetical protein
MNNLTEAQKIIIANLTNEFQSLNNQFPRLSNSFDIGSLLSQLNSDKKRREEILINNIAFLSQLKETAHSYAKQLGDLLKSGNILVWVKSHHNDTSYSIKFGTTYQYHNEHTWINVFSVRVNQNCKTTFFDSKIACAHEYTADSDMSFYHDGNYEIKNIKSLKELVENHYFIGKIKELLVSANR